MDALDVMVALEPTTGERTELERLEEGLGTEGWHKAHFSDLGTGHYLVEEYLNDLTARDAIELTLQRASEQLRFRLQELLAPLDATFLQITVDDVNGFLSTVFRIDPDPAWWWRRIRASPFD